jgi:hypothetical protein
MVPEYLQYFPYRNEHFAIELSGHFGSEMSMLTLLACGAGFWAVRA